jgi:hypothetical protein
MFKKLQILALLVLGGSISAQTVNIVNPSVGYNGQTLPIIISGQNTSFTQGSLSVMLLQGSHSIGQGSNTGINYVIANNTMLLGSLVVPASANLGFYDLFVNSGSSTISCTNAFEVLPSGIPAIAVSPTGSKPGQMINASFTVSGASFKNQMQQNIEGVWLSLGAEMILDVQNIQVINTNSFSADITIPNNATVGFWDVGVYTDDGTMYSSPGYFEINATFSREEFNANNFNIYPNPAGDEFSISLNANYTNLEIKIIDLSGKAINSDQYSVTNENLLAKVKAKGLATGTYLVQLLNDSQLIGTKKLVKK